VRARAGEESKQTTNHVTRRERFIISHPLHAL
jgi:hypothetical protein